MRRLPILALLALLAVCTASNIADAWSFKEHILVTRLAVQRLLADPQTPEEMKRWLREAAPTAGDVETARTLLIETYVGPDPQGLEKLDYWVIFPDRARKLDGEKPVAPFGVPESPMHFVDLELLMPGDDVKQYKHDLSNKPALEVLPRDWRDPRLVQAGYLPWRVEQVYGDLVKAIREERLMPRDEADRDNALVLAGYLAHYLADNTQPQHATIDFRSHSYFAVPRRAPDVHGMFEYGMVDWEGKPYPELRADLWEKLTTLLASFDDMGHWADWAFGGDPWGTTLKVSLLSYDALPLMGTAAQRAAAQEVKHGDPAQPIGAPAREQDAFDVEAFFTTEGEFLGERMTLLDVKAHQLALAVVRIEVMLRQAWIEARAGGREAHERGSVTSSPASRP